MPEADAAPAVSDKVDPAVAGAVDPDAGNVDAGAGKAPAKAVAGKPAANVLDAGDGDDAPVTSPSDWPSDWRTRIAGKFSKELERVQSPEGMWRKYKALQQKLNERETSPFPAEGTDEEKAEWRQSRGVPGKAEEYNTSLGDGWNWGEVDKPFLDDYVKYAHENNASQDEVTRGLKWYNKIQQDIIAKREEADAQYTSQSEEALRAEWGGDFKRNTNAIHNTLNTWPTDVKDALFGARDDAGNRLINNPSFLKQLASIAMEVNPQSALLPPGATSKGVSTRLDEIRKIAREHPDQYDADKKMQAEELELLEVDLKMKSRGKAA